ncbi:hypothetical protein QTO34_019780 [Cnephaeus nilssonii]|uniref:Uncharacterized protein n=1 Tax=Cnephaeus nilssonii TaxID=3371016 RepID=A0AA40LMB3_CNENI|nr:hypothetical protein QTO34_019780 [Eptesicus nilssonii]
MFCALLPAVDARHVPTCSPVPAYLFHHPTVVLLSLGPIRVCSTSTASHCRCHITSAHLVLRRPLVFYEDAMTPFEPQRCPRCGRLGRDHRMLASGEHYPPLAHCCFLISLHAISSSSTQALNVEATKIFLLPHALNCEIWGHLGNAEVFLEMKRLQRRAEKRTGGAVTEQDYGKAELAGGEVSAVGTVNALSSAQTRGPVQKFMHLKGTVGHEAVVGTGAGLCPSCQALVLVCRQLLSCSCCSHTLMTQSDWGQRQLQVPAGPAPSANVSHRLLPRLPLRSRGGGETLRGNPSGSSRLHPLTALSNRDQHWAPAAVPRFGLVPPLTCFTIALWPTPAMLRALAPAANAAMFCAYPLVLEMIKLSEEGMLKAERGQKLGLLG